MEHPITPPPELRRLWAQQAQRMDPHDPVAWMEHVSTQAARWGADQELEACCEHLRYHQWGFIGRFDGTKVHRALDLKLARRPKPPSLAEQATAELDTAVIRGDCITTSDAIPSLRAALKRLQELEEGSE